MGRVYIPSLVTNAICIKRGEKYGCVGVNRASGEMWMWTGREVKCGCG